MLGIFKNLQKKWQFGIGRTAFAAFCAHSVSISIGICQAFSAILIPQLIAQNEINITIEESSWLASLGAVTNPVGSILSGLLAEWFGRKRSIQFSAIPFIVGWATLALSRNILWLYVGRLITGLAAGMSTACYTYVTEISTPQSRGTLQSLGPICASFGILITYTFGYFYHWTVVTYGAIFFGVFSLIFTHLSPESPAWLAKNRRDSESFEALIILRRSNALADQELQALRFLNRKHEKDAISKSNDGSFGKYGFSNSLYFTSLTVKPLCILIVLFLCQEMSGMYNILFYTVEFFQDANFDIDEYLSSIIVGFIRFVMSIAAAVLIAKCTRRSLCIASASGMAFSMLITASYLKYYDLFSSSERLLTLLPLISVLLNVLFSMIGMLPIPWILVGELFPLEVRSIMSGVVICTAQCFIFLTVKLYPMIVNLVGFSNTLYVFAVSSLLTVLFVKAFLPETKNKSLTEIETDFNDGHHSGHGNALASPCDNICSSDSGGDSDSCKLGDVCVIATGGDRLGYKHKFTISKIMNEGTVNRAFQPDDCDASSNADNQRT